MLKMCGRGPVCNVGGVHIITVIVEISLEVPHTHTKLKKTELLYDPVISRLCIEPESSILYHGAYLHTVFTVALLTIARK